MPSRCHHLHIQQRALVKSVGFRVRTTILTPETCDSLALTLSFFIHRLYFLRAVLGAQNSAEGTESSHVLPAPTHGGTVTSLSFLICAMGEITISCSQVQMRQCGWVLLCRKCLPHGGYFILLPVAPLMLTFVSGDRNTLERL